MKKIVPFNNVLQFNTDVYEITAISLEHKINKYPDMISGVFYISGEYKITEGLLDKETFNFELPFDIALSDNYQLDTLMVDVDDFRYDLVADKSLKVNIDLYIDGEIEPPQERNELNENLEPIPLDTEKEDEPPLLEDLKEEEQEEVIETPRIDLLEEMLNNSKEKEMEENVNTNNNQNINNNQNVVGEEGYVTYRVYTVLEGDTLDSILTKYNVTKEMLTDYNNIENINPGDKLIIPTNEK